MRSLIKYINTMYRPSYRLLSFGLFAFSLMLTALAICLRCEMLAGESDVIYRYPDMLNQILYPLYILIPIALCMDLNERKKGRES